MLTPPSMPIERSAMLMMPLLGEARMSQAKAPTSGGTNIGKMAMFSRSDRPGTSVRIASQARPEPMTRAPAVPITAAASVTRKRPRKPPSARILAIVGERQPRPVDGERARRDRQEGAEDEREHRQHDKEEESREKERHEEALRRERRARRAAGRASASLGNPVIDRHGAPRCDAASADDARPLARDCERDRGAFRERRFAAERHDLESRAGPIEGIARRSALVAPQEDAGLVAVGVRACSIADETILGMDHDVDEIADRDGSVMRRRELASRLGPHRGAIIGEARQAHVR